MGSHKTLMFVYIHPRRAGVGISTWRGGGLFISTKAFGDASIKINSTKSLRFSISLTLIKIQNYGDILAHIFYYGNTQRIKACVRLRGSIIFHICSPDAMYLAASCLFSDNTFQ